MSDPSSPTGGTPDAGPRQTGEAIPAQRRLARPPGDRFRTSAPEPIAERPDLGRAAAMGALAGLGTAAVTALFLAILSITAGLVAISILGGWLVGAGVRTGAWSGRLHRPSRAPLALAAGLGAATWVAGYVLAWLVSMAILPDSVKPYLDRLASTPFPDWVAPQLGALDFLGLALLVVVAWVTAHSGALEREAARSGR
jgi:hypothetical protein